MAKQTVNIGSAPNDGTGDTIRDAMDKINDNFDEVYSSLSFGASNTLIIANTIFIGNSSANVTANSSILRLANTSFITNVSPAGVTIGTSTINSTAVAAGANIFLTTTSFFAGNSIVNTTVTQTGLQIANSSCNTRISLSTEAQAGNSFFLHANGSWVYIDVNGTPAGSNTQIQFNDSGEFGANANFTYNKATSTVVVGNSTVNATITSTQFSLANSSSNTTITIPTSTQWANNGFFLNANGSWAYIDVNGTPSGSNTQIQFNDSGEFGTDPALTFDKTTSTLVVGNSTINVAVNGSSISIGTTLANGSYLAVDSANVSTDLTIGTTYANGTYLTVESANLTSNTLTLGTANVSSNGYSRLPNGLLMQWGVVSSNSSTGDITYSDVFTSVYSVTVTPDIAGTYDITHAALIIGSNTSTANVRTANDASVNVSYLAIGV